MNWFSWLSVLLPAIQHGNCLGHQWLRLVLRHNLLLGHYGNAFLDHLVHSDRWFCKLPVLVAVCAVQCGFGSVCVCSEEFCLLKWHSAALT